MARVLHAIHEELDLPVAVKVLKEGRTSAPDLERLRQEARAIARLRGPHVVRVLDSGDDPESGRFIVMELVDGRTLADVIAADGPAVGLATDGYFEVPYDAAWNPSGDFSLEAWIRVAKSTGDYQAILTSRNGGTGVTRTGWTLYVNPTLKPELWQGTDTFWSIIGGPNALVLDTSYHVVATFEGTTSGTQALYVNGAEVASAPVAAFGGNPSKPLRIGAGVTESATASFFFNGTIDEIALYARTLTPAEITEHFTVGSTQR